MQDRNDLKGLSVADVLDLLESHEIGHRLAMEYFGYTSYADLVDTMHANGRIMPGHQPMHIAPETMELVRRSVIHPAPGRAPKSARSTRAKSST